MQTQPPKKVEEPVAVVRATIVKDFWTPESKDPKKRYNRDFLLSLKDKKLSNQFPEVLHNFSELAIYYEQQVNLKDTWIPSLKFILNLRYYRVQPTQQNIYNDFRSGSNYSGRRQNNHNINMVKKNTEVKSITTRYSNEVLLGPGSSGFSWNKAAATPSSEAAPTTTPSASFSSGSSFSSKYQNDDDRRGGLSNYPCQVKKINKNNFF